MEGHDAGVRTHRTLRSTKAAANSKSSKFTGSSLLPKKGGIQKQSRKQKFKANIIADNCISIPAAVNTHPAADKGLSDDDHEARSTRAKYLRKEIQQVVPMLEGGVPKDLHKLETMRKQLDMIALFFDGMGMNVFKTVAEIEDCINKFRASHTVDSFMNELLHKY
ncbi:hypothetical protein HDU99_006290, partial [Rhizoclosmatium hyalinum]